MRKIIFHAGFHKTGTTSLQQTLRANRRALAPDVRLILRPGMTALCEAARGFSRSRDDVDLGLVKYEAALLAQSLAKEPAPTIVIASEDLCGHMPGRHSIRSYGAAPHLMRALSVAFKAALAQSELTFFFTTRAPDAWLRSCYAQHLRASRMVLDEHDYRRRFKASANLDVILDDIKRELPDHALIDASLEEHADRPLGPADAVLDLLGINEGQRATFTAAAVANAAPSAALMAALLELNRSGLEKSALREAKQALIKERA